MSDQTKKKIALVTGANKGIGYEVARQLASQGATVLMGARDEQRGTESAVKLKADGRDVEYVHLDINDSSTHQAVRKLIEDKYGRLDILINNAGIARDREHKASEVSLQTIRETFDTNFFGVIAITQTLLPLIRKSDAGRIVNVSSGLGSLSQNSNPAWPYYGFKPLAYNSSKTALNAFTVILAHELKDTPIKVNSADPGYTATDLNGNSGTKTVAEGAEVIIRLATLATFGATGGYFNDEGVVPW